MRTFILRISYIVLLLVLPIFAKAQQFNITLSPKHEQKLSAIKSGQKRMIKYYKYHRKDSTRQSKERESKYEQVIDSAYKAAKKEAKLRKRLAKKGIILPDNRLKKSDSIEYEIKRWYTILKDSCADDSTRNLAKEKVKDLVVEKAKGNPGFQILMDKHYIQGDSVSWEELVKQLPGIDSLSAVFRSSSEEIFMIAENAAIEKFSDFSGVGALPNEFAEATKLKSLPEKYKGEYSQYANKDQIEKEGKEKALEEAMEYFARHPEKLQNAQAKIGNLLSKYRSFTNSNDLTTAVKRTSMKGKTILEHFVFGGNFNVLSTDPVSVDFSPTIGYRISTAFNVGLGINYRHTFADSIKNVWYISPINSSFKCFANHEIAKGFFAYAEGERSGILLSSNDRAKKIWKNNYFIGAGRKFLIHPKLYLTTTFLYNLNNEDYNPVHPRRFQVRFGFQLSELATRRKHTYYNPNRY